MDTNKYTNNSLLTLPKLVFFVEKKIKLPITFFSNTRLIIYFYGNFLFSSFFERYTNLDILSVARLSLSDVNLANYASPYQNSLRKKPLSTKSRISKVTIYNFHHFINCATYCPNFYFSSFCKNILTIFLFDLLSIRMLFLPRDQHSPGFQLFVFFSISGSTKSFVALIFL